MIKKFSLPGYFNDLGTLSITFEYRKMHPDFFIEDRVFDSAYDFPPGLIWNGGRQQPLHTFTKEELVDNIEWYLKHPELHLRHTCTNLYITPELLYDWQCNYWLQLFESPTNSVITATQILADYVRTRYPKYNIVWSTTLDLTDIDYINQLSSEDMVVLNYNKVNDNNYLQKLQHKENCEILFGETCPPNCTHRLDHYQFNSQQQLWINLEEKDHCWMANHNDYNFYDYTALSTGVTNQRIDELSDMGFQYFKISGRQAPAPHEWFEKIIYYFVKPEYRDGVRQDLLNIYFRVYPLDTLELHYHPFESK